VKHGTESTYKNHGCRCDRCRAAAVDAVRRRRRAAAQLARAHFEATGEHYVAAVGPHGKQYCYDFRGCRCEPCRGANSARIQRVKKTATRATTP